MQNTRNHQVVNFLSSLGLVYLLGHFRQQLRFRHKQTWWKVRQGKMLCSRCNYILGMERRLYKTRGFQEPRNFSYNHFSLHAQLLRWPTRCHGWYLQGQQTLPLLLLKMVLLWQVSTSFQELKALEEPPPPHARVTRPQWMSSYSIHLINPCAALCRRPDHNRNQDRTLTRAVRRSLSMEYRHRA